MKDQLPVITKEASPLVVRAQAVEIASPGDMRDAADLYAKLKLVYKRLTEDKKKLTDPMKAALKEVNSRYEAGETALKDAIDSLNGKMTDYQTAETLKADKKALKIAEKVAEDALAPEVGADKIAALARPEDAIASSHGSLSFRPVSVLKVVDKEVIPRHYFDLNESRLLADLKRGETVLGATIVIEQRPVNRIAK